MILTRFKLSHALTAFAVAFFSSQMSGHNQAQAMDAKAAETAILKTPMMKSLKIDKLAEDGAWFKTKLGTKKTPAVIFNTGTAAAPTWNIAIYPKSLKLGGIYKTGGGAMLGGIALTNPAVVLSEKTSTVVFKDLPKPVQDGIKKVFGTSLKSTSEITYPAGVNFSFRVDLKKSVGLNLLRSTLGVVDTKAAMAGRMGMDFIRYLANGKAATTAGDLDKVSLTAWLKAIKPPKISSYVNAKNMSVTFTGDAKGNVTLGGRTTLNVKVGNAALQFATGMVFEPKAKGADQSLIVMTGKVAKLPSSFGGQRVSNLSLKTRVSGEKKLEVGFSGDLKLRGKTVTFSADLGFAKLPPSLAIDISGDLSVADLLGKNVPGVGGLAFKNAQINDDYVSGTVEFRGVETTAVIVGFGTKKPVLALLHEKFDAEAYLPVIAGTPLDQAEINNAVMIIVPKGSALKATSARDLAGPVEEFIEAALGSSKKFELSEGVNLVGAIDVAKSDIIKKMFSLVNINIPTLPFVGKVSTDILLNPNLSGSAAFKGPSTKGFKAPTKIATRSPRLRGFKIPSLKVFNAPKVGGFKPAVKVGGAKPKIGGMPGAKSFKRPSLAGISDKAKAILASLDISAPIPVPNIPGVSKLLGIKNPTFHILGAEDSDTGEVHPASVIEGDFALKLPGKTIKSSGSISFMKGNGSAVGIAISSTSTINWSKAFGLPFLDLNEIGISGGIADQGNNKVAVNLSLNSEVKLGAQVIRSKTILEIAGGKLKDIGLSVEGIVDIAKLPGIGKIPGMNEFAFNNITVSLKAITGAVLWKRLGISAHAAIMQMDGGATAMFRVADLQLGKFLKAVPEPFASLMFPASVLTFSTKPLDDLTLAELPKSMQGILSGIVDKPDAKVPVFDGVSLIGALGERDFPAPLRKVARDLGVFETLDGPLILSGGINGVFSGLPKIGLYASMPGINLPKNQPLARIVSVDKTQGEFFIRADIASTVFQLGLASNLTISVPHLDNPKKVDELTFRGELYASVDLVSPAGSFKIGGGMKGKWQNPFGFNNFAFQDPAFVIGVDSEGSAEFGIGGTVEFAARKGQKLTYAADFITNINFTSSLPIPKKLGIRLKGKKLGYVAMAEINDSLLRGVLTGPLASVVVNSLPGSEAKKNVKALQTRLKKESLLDILQLNKIPLPIMQLADVDLYFATPGAIIPGREDTLNGMGMVVAGAFEIGLMGNSYRIAEMDTRLTMADGFRVYGALSGMKLGPLKTDKAIFDIGAKPFGLPYFKIHTGAKLFGVQEELDIEVSKTKLGFFYNKDLGPIKLRIDAKTVGEDLLRVRDFSVTARAQNKTFDVITDEVMPNLGLPKPVLDVVLASMKGASRVPPLFIDGLSLNGSLVNFLTGKKPITLSIEHKYFGDRMAPAVAKVKPVWKDPLKAIPHVEIARAMTHSFLIFLSKHPIDLPQVNLGVVKLNKARLSLDGTNLLKPKYEIIGKTEFLGAPREVELVIADKSLKFRVVDKTFDKLTTEILPKLGVPKIVLDIVTKSQPLFVDGFSLEGNSDDFFTGRNPIVMKIEHKYFGDRMDPAEAEVYPVWKNPLKAIPHIEIARAMTKSFLIYLSTHPVDIGAVNLGLVKVEKTKLTAVATNPKDPKFVVSGKADFLGASRDVVVALSEASYAFRVKDKIAGGLWESDFRAWSVGGTALAPKDIKYYGTLSSDFNTWLQKEVGGTMNRSFDNVGGAYAIALKNVEKAETKVRGMDSLISKKRKEARNDLQGLRNALSEARKAARYANHLAGVAYVRYRRALDSYSDLDAKFYQVYKSLKKASRWVIAQYYLAAFRVTIKVRDATKAAFDAMDKGASKIPIDLHPKVAPLLVARIVVVGALQSAQLALKGAEGMNNEFKDITNSLINAVAGTKFLVVNKAIFTGSLKGAKADIHLNMDVLDQKNIFMRMKVNLLKPSETDFRELAVSIMTIIKGEKIKRSAGTLPVPPKLPVSIVTREEVVAAVVAQIRAEARRKAQAARAGQAGITDAIVNWGNGSAYMFSGNQYIRYNIKADRADSGYPKRIDNKSWPGMTFKNVDAVTSWGNGKAYFFSGDQYIRYDIRGDRADANYPRPTNSRSWPGMSFKTIDAVVNWGNGKLFFFSGDQYIRFDIKADRADKGYPKRTDNRSWPGMTFKKVDAVFNWGNGKVHFLSGDQYIRYDIKTDRADSGYPKRVNASSWPGLAFKSKAPGKDATDHKMLAELEKGSVKLQLSSGWLPYQEEYGTPSVAKTGNIVVVSGLIKSGKKGHLATLPAALRPLKRLIFDLNNNRKSSRIDVMPNGQIHWVAGGGDREWLSLSGISFNAKPNGTLKLASGWSPYGGAYKGPTYEKSGNIVTVSGLIKNGKYGHLATLPTDYRPDRRLIFDLNNNDNSSRIDVLPNGQIHWVAGGQKHKWLSLSGIIFHVKPRGKLKLASGWAAYGKDYKTPTYAKSGKLVVVSGLIKNGKYGLLATLPAGNRPTKRLIFDLNNNGNSSRIDVLPNGQIHWSAGGKDHKWLSLTGISFMTIGLSPSANRAPFSCASRTMEFDPCWYSAKYPDIKRIFGGDLTKVTNHWNTFGIKEGRDSSATFSLRAYVARYPDLKRIFGANYRALWNHWHSHGKRERRNPAP